MIDLVVVNLYAFEATVAREGVTEDEAIENIDIGGPSMLRSAAKNFASVTVVTDPADYDARPRRDARQRRRDHARDAPRARDARSSARRARTTTRSGSTSRATRRRVPRRRLRFRLEKVQDLRYGENPHQQRRVLPLRRRQGATRSRAPSSCRARSSRYNNILDTDACWTAVREFDRARVRHRQAHQPVRHGDRRRHRRPRTTRRTTPTRSRAYGGVMAFNRTVPRGAHRGASTRTSSSSRS